MGFAKGNLHEIANLNIGQVAPVFNMPDIDGQMVDLSHYRGQVVVLHFWGRCGFCPRIYPHLRQIAQGYSTDQVALIGVSDDTDMKELRTKIDSEGFTWPQLCEGNGWQDTVFRLYNVNALPSSYILDQQGNIAFKFMGGDTGSDMEKAVASLIA